MTVEFYMPEGGRLQKISQQIHLKGFKEKVRRDEDFRLLENALLVDRLRKRRF
jgi:hypothetical protein